MSKRYIITLMAANRVGILAAVTTALAELGGNLVEVSQTVMQRFFTIILAAEFPDNLDRAVIVDHIRDFCRPYRIDVCLKDPEEETLQEDSPGGSEKFFLTVDGADIPGIIRQIAGRLSEESIDITDLYALRTDRDQSFLMVMELAVPLGVDALALQKELEEMGRSAGLSAMLQHENIFAATNDPRPVHISLGGE